MVHLFTFEPANSPLVLRLKIILLPFCTIHLQVEDEINVQWITYVSKNVQIPFNNIYNVNHDNWTIWRSSTQLNFRTQSNLHFSPPTYQISTLPTNNKLTRVHIVLTTFYTNKENFIFRPRVLNVSRKELILLGNTSFLSSTWQTHSILNMTRTKTFTQILDSSLKVIKRFFVEIMGQFQITLKHNKWPLGLNSWLNYILGTSNISYCAIRFK